MKSKVSITLDDQLMAQIDKMAGKERSRSAVIEALLRRALRKLERSRVNRRDADILNRTSAALNAEMEDVLGHVEWLWEQDRESR